MVAVIFIFSLAIAADTYGQEDKNDSLYVKYKTAEEEKEFTEDDPERIEEYLSMSLEELLNVKIEVASKKEGSIREVPGIVTLITEEEIENAGARDLIDVLRLVPGFSFGVDVEGIVGLGFRGIWAHEGKVLLLIDGQEMQENSYSTLQFGNHYPVNIIKKIEIIRGPGSAIYGGHAELAVINIVTKSAKDLNGIEMTGKFGAMGKDFDNYAHRDFTLSFGKTFGDFSLVTHGFIGSGNRSDETFTDFYGGTYNMLDSNTMNPLFFNVGVKYKNLSTRFIVDQYNTQNQDIYFENAPEPLEVDFPSYFAEVKYDLNVNESLTITPKFNYKWQRPWLADSDYAKELEMTVVGEGTDWEYYPYAGVFESATIQRYTGNLSLSYDFNEKINLIAGTEFYREEAEAEDKIDYFTPDDSPEGVASVDYNNFAAFSQIMAETQYGNFTLGARYDKHSEAGSSFVPRFAFTKVLEDLHFKLLFSKAFRAPGISNINDFLPRDGENGGVDPENTTVFEVESGLKMTDRLFLTANGFIMQIKDPIVYYYDAEDAYDNYEKTGTLGAEMELKYKTQKAYTNLTYSFYRSYENEVDQYEVPKLGEIKKGDYEIKESVHLGFPTHKLTFNGSFNVWESLYVNPSAIFNSTKYGFGAVYLDEEENEYLEIKEFDPHVLLNLSVMYRDLFTEGLDCNLSAYNLLNDPVEFVQPYYDGWHAPMPGASMELLLKVSYAFNLK